MKNIKAIQTEYNGYKFRSRLEARWAVFFDNMNITYQYEPEGFETPHGWYLPDFYLPDFNAWVEVKGGRNLTKNELEKFLYVCLTTYSYGITITNDPYDALITPAFKRKTFDLVHGSVLDSSKDVESYYEIGDLLRFHTNGVYSKIVHFIIGELFHYYDEDQALLYEDVDICLPGAYDEPNENYIMEPMFKNSYDLIKVAATNARQARFEHGETPILK